MARSRESSHNGALPKPSSTKRLLSNQTYTVNKKPRLGDTPSQISVTIEDVSDLESNPGINNQSPPKSQQINQDAPGTQDNDNKNPLPKNSNGTDQDNDNNETPNKKSTNKITMSNNTDNNTTTENNSNNSDNYQDNNTK
eukprot:9485052-Ditylum_brightwellii.AAC.1